MAHPEVLGSLRASRLFGKLAESQLLVFARSTNREQLQRGELLWRAGDEPSAITIITSGLVKICKNLRPGMSTIVGLFGPRESIGDVAVVSGRVYPADAIAASDRVELLRVEKKAVLEAMERDSAVAMAVNHSLVEHSAALQDKIRVLAAGAVDHRLATLLLHLAERFGDEQEDESTFIPVALSRAELSLLVGSTIETTIRIMSRWQKEGLVQTLPEGFVITRAAALEDVANDCVGA
ncbi:helix-turn-helix domain-containing protein [soil metagenome]